MTTASWTRQKSNGALTGVGLHAVGSLFDDFKPATNSGISKLEGQLEKWDLSEVVIVPYAFRRFGIYRPLPRLTDKHAFGVDDDLYSAFLFPIPFSGWVSSIKRYWIIPAERQRVRDWPDWILRNGNLFDQAMMPLFERGWITGIPSFTRARLSLIAGRRSELLNNPRRKRRWEAKAADLAALGVRLRTWDGFASSFHSTAVFRPELRSRSGVRDARTQ